MRQPIAVRVIRGACLALTAAASLIVAPRARGQCDEPVEVQKLIGSVTAMEDRFGEGVATDGVRILVGAPGENAGSVDSGAAYIFARQGGMWVEEARLTLPSPAPNSYMGALLTVAIEGDTAVIGADGYSSQSGLVVIFKRQPDGTWAVGQSLTSSSLSSAGRAVRLQGDRLLVGARNVSASSGRLHVYKRTGGGPFALEQTLAATPEQSNAFFGQHAAIDGDTIVVGAQGENSPATDAGAAYVFRFNGATWTQQARLTAPDADANDLFGNDVGISGDTVAIGAWGEDTNGSDSGSIYIFSRDMSDAWVFAQKIMPSTPTPTAAFGARLQLSGEMLLASANGFDGLASDGGAAFLFRRNAGVWAQSDMLVPNDPGDTDNFGASVSLAGTVAVAGSFFDNNVAGTHAGSAYVFDLDPVGLTIEDQPDSVSTGPGQTAQFTVAVSGTGPIAYQWRRSGVALQDNFPFSGANTATLTINPTFVDFGGTYGCVISNVCGSMVTTDPATLAVPYCTGDGNASRTVTFDDILAALANFGGVCP